MNTDVSPKLNVGIIGLGYWGPKLARNFNDLPNAELKMAADLREDRLAEIKNCIHM
jgi:predicted dehydrogenase